VLACFVAVLAEVVMLPAGVVGTAATEASVGSASNVSTSVADVGIDENIAVLADAVDAPSVVAVVVVLDADDDVVVFIVVAAGVCFH
jgi:hypothetical protein